MILPARTSSLIHLRADIITLEITLNSKELEVVRLELLLLTQYLRAEFFYQRVRELEGRLRVQESAEFVEHPSGNSTKGVW